MSVITLPSEIDEVVKEAGWSVLAGANAGERSAASVSVGSDERNGAFLGSLEARQQRHRVRGDSSLEELANDRRA